MSKRREKALMNKIKHPKATIRVLQGKIQRFKIFLEEIAPQPLEKKGKGIEALFSSIDVRYTEISSTILNMIMCGGHV